MLLPRGVSSRGADGDVVSPEHAANESAVIEINAILRILPPRVGRRLCAFDDAIAMYVKDSWRSARYRAC